MGAVNPLDTSHLGIAVILGFVQGLTEFLPVSSSAHLRIAGLFLPGAEDPGATFTAITQIGTELAVLIYFARDIGGILKSWWLSVFSRGRRQGKYLTPEQRTQAKIGWYIIFATIPIGALGYLFQDTIRETFRSLWLISTVLIVFGILLWVADRAARSDRYLSEMNAPHGITIGLAQVLALIPGVSRSGATITMARALGYRRDASARFAFLLAIPAVLISGLFELYSALKDEVSGTSTIPAIPFSWVEIGTATAVAFVVGLGVIAFLMRYLQSRSFLPFVIYRVLLGGTLLTLLATGVIAG
jgi:undecaprenyl-diphosphatase